MSRLVVTLLASIAISFADSTLSNITLYSAARSSSSWRVRAALDLKGIPYKLGNITDKDGEYTEAFLRISPFRQVPAISFLDDDREEQSLTQSLAIIQFIDESFPSKRKLLPDDPITRARVRMVSDSIAAGIQPLTNLAVLEVIDEIEEGAGKKFAIRTFDKVLEGLEQMLLSFSGKYSVGDTITMADVCLVPQVHNAAAHFGIDIMQYDTMYRVYNNLIWQPEFRSSHPHNFM